MFVGAAIILQQGTVAARTQQAAVAVDSAPMERGRRTTVSGKTSHLLYVSLNSSYRTNRSNVVLSVLSVCAVQPFRKLVLL
jgi:hypothetical protein